MEVFVLSALGVIVVAADEEVVPLSVVVRIV